MNMKKDTFDMEQYLSSGQLKFVNPAKELRRQKTIIRKIEKDYTFLKQYDLLFRYVSIWLAYHKVKFTNRMPHKTLITINSTIIKKDIARLVKHRHEVKYKNKMVNNDLLTELRKHNEKWKKVVNQIFLNQNGIGENLNQGNNEINF